MIVPPDEDCQTIETRWYERTCYYYPDAIECTEWVYIGSTCQTYCSNSSGGGGGGYSEPGNNDDNDGIAEIKEIIDAVTNACLKSTLNTVISSSLSNNITNILYNTFGGTTDFNIKFADNSLNDDMKDGNTSTTIFTNGRMDFTVTLNTDILPGASKEYTAITIYHEILHAYLRSGGMASGAGLQHNTMANSYVSGLISSLLSAFPTLDPLDAKALAWGGLQDTPAYDSIRVNHPAEYDDLRVRNSQHRANTKGTPSH